MARSLEHRPAFRGWTASIQSQRTRIRSRLASVDRRQQRRDVGFTEGTDDGIEKITALSEPLSAFTVERKS
jgi:hypothetical protein